MEAATVTPEGKEISTAKRRLLEQRLAGLRRTSAEVILPRPKGARVPISVEQHRVWLHTAMEPELPIYNESVTIHRRGSFDLEILQRSFNDVLRRHEVWRTTFAMDQGELSQIVHPKLELGLALIDLSDLPEEQRHDAACRLATEDAVTAIDLKTLPLFRARVFRISSEDHWLQLTLHHIIFDGVSIHRIFLPELAATYAAFVKGKGSPYASGGGLQYADYSIWREKQLNSPVMDQHLAYWREKLAGELPVLKLPSDRPRPALMSHRGSMEYFTLPANLTGLLHAFSREQGATLYMTFLAALKTLFFRYSGHEDLIVGGLSDGRRRSELESLMGYFLDTFAIRTQPKAEMPFSVYLAQVRDAVLGALAAAEVPFSHVVQAIQPYRDHSHHPVFQTFLALQPEAEAFADGWDVSKTNVIAGVAKFDLYIEVDERLHHAGIRIMYSTDLFDGPTIRRMGEHWITLLAAITETPDCALAELPLLTAAERELMLLNWNSQQQPVPALTLHEMVEAQTRKTPNALAITFESHSCTYAELDQRAEHLAEILREKGAAPGRLVAVCLERSLYLPVALLAILKTGAAYLPLDPGTPRARRLMCLEDASPSIIVTQRSLHDDLPPTGAAIVELQDAFTNAPRRTKSKAVKSVVRLDDVAYVIHTSGSTGRPKGVEISHGAVVNLLVSMSERPGFSSSDSLLALTTISFDIAGLELFLPLITGGEVVIVPRAMALDPDLLARAITRSGCTVVQATPATWRALLGTGWKGRPGLRVLCGGEAMTRDLADSLLALDLEVWNVYGPTETTIWSTVHRVQAGTGPVPVGRPIANTSTYILDQQYFPVPIGVTGELYIGGKGLAIGYRDQPQLTADKFVLRPSVSHERLYRTGDHALYRADGTIEIQGRADNQVKIRGYRIELEDVEASVAAHPMVSAAVAKTWPDRSGGNRLSVYITAKEGVMPDEVEVREFLRLRVPDYMIPSDIVMLARMPLTSNGKMDRKALLEPVYQAARSISVPPTSEQELRLAAIWTDLLGLSSVNTDENFFDLGGHSLLVARLQQRIFTEFGQRVAMAAIFHAPTIASQVNLLAEGDQSNRSRLIPLQTQGSKPRIFWIQPPPLIQNLVAGLDPEQPLYGVTVTMEDLEGLGPEPNVEAFAASCVKTIVQFQSSGPYYIGGLCTSGILAYEVASQLAQAGETVASLVMLDAENPVFYRRFDTLAIEISKLFFYGNRAIRKQGMRMFFRHVQSRLMRLISLEKAAATEMSAIESALLAAAFRYRPPVYRGNVLLLLPEDRPKRVDYLPGWQAVIEGSMTCKNVSGHHDELLDAQHAVEIAQIFTAHFSMVGAAVDVYSFVG